MSSMADFLAGVLYGLDIFPNICIIGLLLILVYEYLLV